MSRLQTTYFWKWTKHWRWSLKATRTTEVGETNVCSSWPSIVLWSHSHTYADRLPLSNTLLIDLDSLDSTKREQKTTAMAIENISYSISFNLSSISAIPSWRWRISPRHQTRCQRLLNVVLHLKSVEEINHYSSLQQYMLSRQVSSWHRPMLNLIEACPSTPVLSPKTRHPR